MSTAETNRRSGFDLSRIPNVSPTRVLSHAIREMCERKLYAFVQHAWNVVEQNPLIDSWHIGAICDHLQAVTEGQIRNLLICIPPGCTKSLLAAVFWPAWEWTRDPSMRHLCVSYDQRLSTRDAVRTRTVLSSQWYQSHWPDVQFSKHQNEKTYYETTSGGYRLATSVDGHLTGRHPHRIILDDVSSAKHAESEVERQIVKDFYELTLSSRGIAVGVRRVMIGQRLHQEDLPGYVLDNQPDEWEKIILPMRYEKNRMPITVLGWTDPRKEEGELLCPDQYSEDDVVKLERDLRSYGTAGQLQQRPAPREGGMFKPGWFQIRNAPPAKAKWVRAWDLAGTANEGDWTVGLLMARDSENHYWVVDVIRTQSSAYERDRLVRQTAELDGNNVRIVIEQEPGSSGLSMLSYYTKMLAGFVVKGWRPTGPKEIRAEAFAAQAEAGNVFLIKGPWNRGYLDELSVFNKGKYDDRVDASSMAFHSLAKSGPLVVGVGHVSRDPDEYNRPLSKNFSNLIKNRGGRLGRPFGSQGIFGHRVRKGFEKR